MHAVMVQPLSGMLEGSQHVCIPSVLTLAVLLASLVREWEETAKQRFPSAYCTAAYMSVGMTLSYSGSRAGALNSPWRSTRWFFLVDRCSIVKRILGGGVAGSNLNNRNYSTDLTCGAKKRYPAALGVNVKSPLIPQHESRWKGTECVGDKVCCSVRLVPSTVMSSVTHREAGGSYYSHQSGCRSSSSKDTEGASVHSQLLQDKSRPSWGNPSSRSSPTEPLAGSHTWTFSSPYSLSCCSTVLPIKAQKPLPVTV